MEDRKMKKKHLLLLFFLLIGNVPNVNAESIKSEGWYDVNKLYLNNDYTEISEAMKKAENFFGENIELPTRLPPIIFTHMLGKFETNKEFSRLEITYLNEESGNVRYKISVLKASPEKEHEESSVVTEKIKSSDGNEIIHYKNNKNFDTFIINKKGFEYAFFIDKTSFNKITIEDIVKIIDSMK